MKSLRISICVLFLLMTLALPVSAETEVYFGDVTTLYDGSKIVSLMVKDVDNLGTCDAIIKLREGVVVTDVDVTSGGGNAITVRDSNIDDTEGSVTVTAWDASTAHSGTVVLCNIAYTGSDSNPFEIGPVELYDYDTYDKIQHTGNNDIDRSSDSSGSSTVKPTATKAADETATSVATVSGGDAGGEGAVAESTEIVDENNGSSGENNNGIPGFGLLTGLSVMLIAVRQFRENK